jgi:hypothetical protein
LGLVTQPYPYEKGKKITVLGPTRARPNSNGSSRTQSYWVLLQRPNNPFWLTNRKDNASDRRYRQCHPQSNTLCPQSNTLLGLAGMQDPTLLTCFGSVLGLTCQPDPTALGPATKGRPNGFRQRMSHPQPQFLTKNKGKERSQGATVSSTVQILYDIVSFIEQCVCVHSKSPVFFPNVLIYSKITMQVHS